MPRAYDQIVMILNRLNAVRANIDALNTTLEQVCYQLIAIISISMFVPDSAS